MGEELQPNGLIGGGGRIRTYETLSGPTVFKTVAFNHSATPPPLGVDTGQGSPEKLTVCLITRRDSSNKCVANSEIAQANRFVLHLKI